MIDIHIQTTKQFKKESKIKCLKRSQFEYGIGLDRKTVGNGLNTHAEERGKNCMIYNSSTVIWNSNKNIHSFEENMYKLLGMTSLTLPSQLRILIVIEGKTNSSQSKSLIAYDRELKRCKAV